MTQIENASSGRTGRFQSFLSSAWVRSRTLKSFVLLLLALNIGSIFPVMRLFSHHLSEYLHMMLIPILLGLVIGGIIDFAVPQDYISHLLSKSRKRTILNAVLLGFLMSVCSHGILALAVQIHKKGASTAAVVAFLLASPWANVPITILLISLFKAKAAFFILGALLVAVTTGLIFQWLEKKKWVETNTYTVRVEDGFSVKRDIQRRMQAVSFGPASLWNTFKSIAQSSWALGEMVLWWILLGASLASLAGAYVPDTWFHRFMGPGILGIAVTLVFATILEVCSEGTAPLAFELYRNTGALGNAFVFLMAGVATDYTEIGLIWMNIGRRAAYWLPLVTVPQILLLGYLANQIF